MAHLVDRNPAEVNLIFIRRDAVAVEPLQPKVDHPMIEVQARDGKQRELAARQKKDASG